MPNRFFHATKIALWLLADKINRTFAWFFKTKIVYYVGIWTQAFLHIKQKLFAYSSRTALKTRCMTPLSFINFTFSFKKHCLQCFAYWTYPSIMSDINRVQKDHIMEKHWAALLNDKRETNDCSWAFKPSFTMCTKQHVEIHHTD